MMMTTIRKMRFAVCIERRDLAKEMQVANSNIANLNMECLCLR